MNKFKLVFVRDAVLLCNQVNQVNFDGNYIYEHDRKGKLIYAIVKAHDEREAVEVAFKIREEVSERLFGKDFIF